MERLDLSEAEWRRRLTPAQYHVLREAGTGRADPGPLSDTVADGIYACAACRLDLFDSVDRIGPGSGWPSFSRPIAPDRLTAHSDARHGTIRTEIRCARCDGHQGRALADNPPPAAPRYCINPLALAFRGRR